jgi:hypothetical protein
MLFSVSTLKSRSPVYVRCGDETVVDSICMRLRHLPSEGVQQIQSFDTNCVHLLNKLGLSLNKR